MRWLLHNWVNNFSDVFPLILSLSIHPRILEISFKNPMEWTISVQSDQRKGVHFDQFGHFGRLDWNVLFH